MVNFIHDKEAIYEVEKYDVVLMGVSTHNQLMGNFQAKMGVKYPIIEEVNNSTPYGDKNKLGKRITIDDLGDGQPIVSLMYMCQYPSKKAHFIDYDAFEHCLKTANAEFKGKRILMTFIGTTKFDGKGDPDKCLEIIENSLKDVDVDIYDYEQMSIREELRRQNKYFAKLRKENSKDREYCKKIVEMQYEMRKKCFLPLNLEIVSRKPEHDEILNY